MTQNPDFVDLIRSFGAHRVEYMIVVEALLKETSPQRTG